MKYKVLIDTCIYKQMQYKFKEPYNLTLDLLKQQIDINKIEILMPIIVKKEIEKHLTPNIEQINTHLKKYLKIILRINIHLKAKKIRKMNFLMLVLLI